MLNRAVKLGLDGDSAIELTQYLDAGDYLLVAEELIERLGRATFHDFIVQTFEKPSLRPTEVHRMLPLLPFSAVLTTNYDSLLESAYTLVNGVGPRVFTHRDYPELARSLRDKAFYVLKLHGTYNRIETIILGRTHYREIVYASPAYRDHLQSVFAKNTLLFLGFGLNDPDLILVLEQLQAHFRGYGGMHFALMPESEVPPIKRKRIRKDLGIWIVPYSPSSAKHAEVGEFVEELLSLVQNKNSMARIILTNDDGGGRESVCTDKHLITVGRGESCDISVPCSAVSRVHCELSRGERGLYVRDKGSVNGTLVNGKRLAANEDCLVDASDVIVVGTYSMQVSLVDKSVSGSASEEALPQTHVMPPVSDRPVSNGVVEDQLSTACISREKLGLPVGDASGSVEHQRIRSETKRSRDE